MSLDSRITVYNGTFKAELLFNQLLYADKECSNRENANKRYKLANKEYNIFENNLCQKNDFVYYRVGWSWRLGKFNNTSRVKFKIVNNHGYRVYLVQKDWAINYFGYDEMEKYGDSYPLESQKTALKNALDKKPKHKIDIIVLLILIRNTNWIWNNCISIDVLKNHIIPHCFFDDVVLVSYIDKDYTIKMSCE
jgi:hypothetical protein